MSESGSNDPKQPETRSSGAMPTSDLGNLANLMAHQLATPLRLIAGHAAILRGEVSDGAAAQAARDIESAVARMQAVMDSLIFYGGTADIEVAVEPIDADKELDAALSSLEEQIERSGSTIVRAALPEVLAQPTALRAVFRSLILNGIEAAAPEPARIEISCSRGSGVWTFEVADNGSGIDPREQVRIFDPFVRARTARGRTGAGLGLTLARRIVERHGGRIWLESKPGEGSIFRFSLPIEPRRATDPPRG